MLKINFVLNISYVHPVKPQVAQDELLKWDMLSSNDPNGPGGPKKMENVPNKVTCPCLNKISKIGIFSPFLTLLPIL